MPRERGDVVALTLPAPWGPVHIAATARGIVAVELRTTRDGFEAGLERRLGRRLLWVDPAAGGSGAAGTPDGATLEGNSLPAVRHLRAAARAIDAEASGRETGGGARLPLDLEDRPAWDRAVLDAVRAIPRGETQSYGAIARAIGRPGAARAVGGAVGRNPISLLIPCHRVIAADGSLGGYGGDPWGSRDEWLALKRELLLREGITVRNRGG